MKTQAPSQEHTQHAEKTNSTPQFQTNAFFTDNREGNAVQRKQINLAANSPKIVAQQHSAQQLKNSSHVSTQLKLQQHITDNTLQRIDAEEPAKTNTTEKIHSASMSNAPSVQRKLYINGGLKLDTPTREEDPDLIAAADTFRVPESEIIATLQRWITKKKDYTFPSWKWAFEEAAKGKLKTAKGDEDKINAFAQKRDEELNKIEDEAYRRDLAVAREKAQTEIAIREWESRAPERELVNDLKKFARQDRNRVASVVVDRDSLEIKGKGRSGDLTGRRRQNQVEVDGANPALVQKLNELGPTQEGWEVWNCGEVAAAQNAISLGETYIGRCFLAGEKGGALIRKCACGNCRRWTAEIPRLNLGGGLFY